MATSSRHDDSDGSDIFWPGYVDATTNLILNLLFLLTILMVAVFMFALELGRTSKTVPGESIPAATAKKDGITAARTKEEAVLENIALRQEIERLNEVITRQQLEGSDTGGTRYKTVDATTGVPKPLRGLDRTLTTDFDVMVRFQNDAVEFTAAEHQQLVETLKAVAASGGATIYVEVPTGFSEAKRMAFYRAMAVRNLLIELNLPKEKIDLTIHEGPDSANAANVKVRSQR